jgi:hypothetical protein
MWWLFHNENGPFAARDVHDQTIYADSTAYGHSAACLFSDREKCKD